MSAFRYALRTLSTRPGFSAVAIVTPAFAAEAPLSPVTYATSEQRNRFVDALRRRLRELPGVKSADVATAPPFAGPGSTIHINIIERPPTGPEDYILTGYRAVGPDSFPALTIPLRHGRTVSERDRERSRPVAVVNETFVRRFFDADSEAALRSRVQLGTVPDDDPAAPVYRHRRRRRRHEAGVRDRDRSDVVRALPPVPHRRDRGDVPEHHDRREERRRPAGARGGAAGNGARDRPRSAAGARPDDAGGDGRVGGTAAASRHYGPARRASRIDPAALLR
jgi:hypothetical protein